MNLKNSTQVQSPRITNTYAGTPRGEIGSSRIMDCGQENEKTLAVAGRSTLSETDAVRRGAAFLKGLRMSGWPREFDCQQDRRTARGLKNEIIEAKNFYEMQLQPDTPEMLLTRVEMLQLRGWEKDLPDAAYEQIQAEWVEDLLEYPADLVNKACRAWRRKNSNRAPYAAGELMESVKAEYVRRKCIFKNAETVLGLIA